MSDDSINYALRPNKAVERKIVFGCLGQLSRVVPLSDHTYIGMGSVWFVDFVLAHKTLGLNSLKSIERNAVKASRAEFNKPFGCTEVIHGHSNNVLPKLLGAEGQYVIWLDYTDTICREVLQDLSTVAEKAPRNTVLIVTIGARSGGLPEKNARGEDISQMDSLRDIAGSAVPASIPSKRLQRDNYPSLLSEVLENFIHNAISKSGRAERYLRLFDLAYSDGIPMATMGGIISDQPTLDRVDAEVVKSGQWEGIIPGLISVPALTFKEKLTMDSQLPSAGAIDQAGFCSLIGFQLKPAQIEAYARYYKYYPAFGELAP